MPVLVYCLLYGTKHYYNYPSPIDIVLLLLTSLCPYCGTRI